jgi:hypothetical protein
MDLSHADPSGWSSVLDKLKGKQSDPKPQPRQKYLNRTGLSPEGDLADNSLVPQPASVRPVPALEKSAHQLPPLILHPISGQGEVLAEPNLSDPQSRRLEAHRLELKMLCLLGKDLVRWIEQCLEFARMNPDVPALSEGQLMDLLVENPPEGVVRKMQTWGVGDFRTIFARSLGLAAVFPHPPGREHVSDVFVRDFARYADTLYRVRRQSLPAATETGGFVFEVYASGEYAQLLERAWGL